MDVALTDRETDAMQALQGRGPSKRLGALLVALLCVCSTGQAKDSIDLSSMTFWLQPLSDEALPVELRGGIARDQASEASASRDVLLERAESEPVEVDREALSDAVDSHLDSLAEEQALNGERSPALIGQLASLADLYQQLGQHDAAIAALQDAIQTTRINYGLYSLEQVDAVESLIASRQAEGQYERATSHREYIKELALRNSHDPRVVSVLSGLADSEMDAARSLIDVPAPPEINIGGSADPAWANGRYPSLPPQRPAYVALCSARRDYIAAINAAVRTHEGNIADLFAMQDALIETVYFELTHPQLRSGRVGCGTNGLSIIRAKVTNAVNFKQPPIAIAKALIELGDWYLLGSANAMALDQYQAAHDLLVEQGIAGNAIDDLLSPAVAAVLPVLPASLTVTGPERAYRGHVDAAVELYRFGGVKSVEVLDASPGTSKIVEKRLQQYIKRHRFRPRFVAGELARSDRFLTRVYYDY